MIEVSSVSKSYNGTYAVKDISFKVPEGKTLVLLGTSGCGKTTTLKMINRLIKPDKGEIRINEKPISEHPVQDLRRNIGYVIQQVGLFPHYTVSENIAVVPKLLGWEEKAISSRTLQLIELLGLSTAFLDRFPHELSGGQQQRVGLARALAADPPVVLLDEPFGALDPITRSSIQEDFRGLEGLMNKTMVLVTHDVMEAMRLGDLVAIMEAGVIRQLGTPQQLVFHPEHPFVEEFLKQRLLQLQLQTVNLRDLRPWLATSLKDPEKPVLLTLETTLWEALTMLDHNGHGTGLLEDTEKVLDRACLWEAFEKFKQDKEIK